MVARAVSPDAAPRLAVFDLDGTLTRSDTFSQFVVAALRRWPTRVWRLPLALAPLLRYALARSDRGELKGELLHCLLGGLHRNQVAALAADFATRVVTRGVHAEAPEVLRAHRVAGDVLVLMSASPDLYVATIAALLGFDACRCTAVRWDGEFLDGRLAGPNCRGLEKSKQLGELRRLYPGRAVIAYGNSTPDLDHMRSCENAVYVNATGHERRALEAEGMAVVRWH
jgi:phosphatidylglycerophosphatase C